MVGPGRLEKPRLIGQKAEVDADGDAAGEPDLDPISDTVEKDQLESARRWRSRDRRNRGRMIGVAGEGVTALRLMTSEGDLTVGYRQKLQL